MPEVVCGLAGAERGNEPTDAAAQSRDGSLGELAKQSFEFAERHLDRVQVGRIFGQIPHKNALHSSATMAMPQLKWETL